MILIETYRIFGMRHFSIDEFSTCFCFCFCFTFILFLFHSIMVIPHQFEIICNQTPIKLFTLLFYSEHNFIPSVFAQNLTFHTVFLIKSPTEPYPDLKRILTVSWIYPEWKISWNSPRNFPAKKVSSCYGMVDREFFACSFRLAPTYLGEWT